MPRPKTASQIVRQVTNRLFPEEGCTDGGCIFGHPGGMHTNGGCMCIQERNPVQLKMMLLRISQVARTLAAVAEDPE